MEQQKKRCVVYTRKSHEEGLDQAFNSLDAQRQACESYIQSQQFNGWELMPKRYDDGGFSGGTLERPALKELLADIEAGKVDVVVIYKIDRLSRSLVDFAELQSRFEKHGVSFVSVTQQIDTSGSTGRMMLNILMTFAQYEREIIADRIRDKMAATRKQGKFAGGTLPYGYKSENKKMVIRQDEAEVLKRIFQRYLEIQSPKQIAIELNSNGLRIRTGREWNTSHIYRQLNSYACIGKVEYKGQIYDGEHEAIIPMETWNEVQRLLKINAATPKGDKTRESVNAPLKGILRCGHCGCAMMPHYARKSDGRKYYYYICQKDSKRGKADCPVHRIPGSDIEKIVMDELGRIFRSETFRQLIRQQGVAAGVLDEQFSDMGNFWDGLYPAERQKLLHLMIDKVTVYGESLEIEVKTAGIQSIYEEFENEQVQPDEEW